MVRADYPETPFGHCYLGSVVAIVSVDVKVGAGVRCTRRSVRDPRSTRDLDTLHDTHANAT